MTALEDLFARTRAEGRAALVGYLPAGFPTVDGAIEAVLAMVEAGVDTVEIGIPYSDPLMDGPTVQAAAEQALAAGTRMADVFRTVEAVASTGAPALVMTYWNPIERYGVDAFARDFAAAGGAGVITPDLIPDEAAGWLDAVGASKVDPIFLVAPSSSCRADRPGGVREPRVHLRSVDDGRDRRARADQCARPGARRPCPRGD